MRSLLFVLFLVLTASGSATAQDIYEVDFQGLSWQTNGDSVSVREHLGREALFVDRAFVWTTELQSSDGVIEYDVAAVGPSGFVGNNFHMRDQETFEQFYLRFHQSGQPDATQYMAGIGGLGAWQLHAGPNDATAVELPVAEWISIKIVTVGTRAEIYVGDMETPLLHVPELRAGVTEGGSFAFYASDRPWVEISGAYFSNLRWRELEPGEGLISAPREEPALPEGLVTQWEISNRLDEEELAASHDLSSINVSGLHWNFLEVERNGIVNIARVAGAPNQGLNTVLARLQIQSDGEEFKQIRFGYSDRVRVYVNGEQVFFGNAGWRSRDHRFLGTIGLEDAIVARLLPGENEIIFAVSESFGGWGVTAAIDP